MGKLTINQIAELAEVSRSVVSRVLNDRPSVNDATRARVLKVIREHNYVPSAVARSLVTQRRFEVGLLFARRSDESLTSGFWALVYLGISETCLERGYMVSATMISPEQAQNRIIGRRKFDGYIMVTAEMIEAVAASVIKREIPAVIIGPNSDMPEITSVDTENQRGGYLATRHLIDLGHRRIGAITSQKEPEVRRNRIGGYHEALEEAGIPIQEELIVADGEAYRGGYEAMRQLLQQSPRPTAVFCDSDVLAFGALQALHEAGIRVPDEMAMVGLDDLPMAKYSSPALTTVRQPIYRMGQEAAHLLIDQIEGKQEASVRKVLPVELIIRDSCGAVKRVS